MNNTDQQETGRAPPLLRQNQLCCCCQSNWKRKPLCMVEDRRLWVAEAGGRDHLFNKPKINKSWLFNMMCGIIRGVWVAFYRPPRRTHSFECRPPLRWWLPEGHHEMWSSLWLGSPPQWTTWEEEQLILSQKYLLCVLIRPNWHGFPPILSVLKPEAISVPYACKLVQDDGGKHWTWSILCF